MADAISGVAVKSGAIPSSAGDHHHDHDHGHAHSHEPAAPALVGSSGALSRPYKRSMFLASAVERLVIALLLAALLWLGIFWAVS